MTGLGNEPGPEPPAVTVTVTVTVGAGGQTGAGWLGPGGGVLPGFGTTTVTCGTTVVYTDVVMEVVSDEE